MKPTVETLETILWLHSRCIQQIDAAYQETVNRPMWAVSAVKRHKETIKEIRAEIEARRHGNKQP